MARLGRGFPATPITEGFSVLMVMPAPLILDPASGEASATLANIRPLPVPCAPASGTASGSMEITVPVEVPLDAADPVSFAPLDLTAPVALSLDASSGVADNSLALVGFPTFTFTSSATATVGSLPLKITTQVTLGSAGGVATGSLMLAALPLSLGSASAIASNSLALTAPPKPSLAATGVATASLALSLLVQPVSVSLAPASALASTGTLVPTATTRVRLDEANPRATTSLVLTGGGAAVPITRRAIGALADAIWPNVAGADNSPAPIPAGTVAGDFMLLIVVNRHADATITTPAGWTSAFNNRGGAAGANDGIRIQIFWKFHTGSESNPAIDWPASFAGPRNAFITSYTGVDTTTPINGLPAAPSYTAATGGGPGPITGFTPAANSGPVIVVGVKADDWTAGTASVLTGDGLTWTELMDAATTAGNDAGLVVDEGSGWTSGAIANKTFTVTGGTSVPSAGIMFALNKAAGVTATERILPLAGASGTVTASLAVKAETRVPLQPVSALASPTLALAISPQISLTASSAMATATLAPTVPVVAPMLPLQASASSATALALAVAAPTTLPFIAAGASAATATTLSLTAPPLLSLTANPVATATGSLVVTPKLSLNVSGLSEGLLSLTTETQIPNLSSSGTATTTLAVGTAAPTPVQVPLNVISGSATTSLNLAILPASPVVVASAVHTTTDPTTSVSVTIPATQADDLLIFQCSIKVGTSALPTIGGTYGGTLTMAEDIGAADKLVGYWSRASGNHSGQTVTFSDTANSMAASMIVVRGALASGNPIEASKVQEDQGLAAAMVMPGITTTVANTLVVAMFYLRDNFGWSGQQLNGVNMTEHTETLSGGGSDCAGGIATIVKTGTGATGNFTWTAAGGGTATHRGIGFAIKPVAPTGVTHRIFDGSGSIGNSVLPINNLTGAFTLAAVVRRTDPTDVVMAILHTTSGFGSTLYLSLAGTTGFLRVATGTARTSTLALTEDDGWGIIVVTKAAGTVTPRFHLYKGGSWSHEAAVGTIPNAVDHTGGATLFANSVLAEHTFDLAVAGEWNTALSDGQVETLDWASQNWADLAPLSLWNFNQTITTDPIPDLVGGVDLAGNAGAPIGIDGPDGWNYDLAEEVTLSAAPAIATATAMLALNAPTRVTLAASSTAATATLALTAQTRVPLQAAPVTATASVAVTAPTRVPLAASSSLASVTLALTAPTQVSLAAVSAAGTASLSLIVTPRLSLSATSISSGTLTLILPGLAIMPLAPTSAIATATLALKAPALVSLAATSASATATLDLKSTTRVPLSTVSSTATASLDLKAPTRVPLNTASGIATAALALTAPPKLTLAATSALGTATVSLKVPTLTPLGSASALGVGSLALKTVSIILLAPGSAVGSPSLLVRVPLRLTLSTSTAVATTFAQVDAFGAVLHEARPPTNFTVLSARLTRADVEQAVRVAIAPEAGVLTGANADVLLSAANPAPQADRDAVDLSPGPREASRDGEPVRSAVVLDAYDSES